MGPERVEPLVLLLCGYHAEQVLESALKQGIALHVEEHVTGIRPWQAGESATRLGLKEVVDPLARPALACLQPGLMAEALQGPRLDACAARATTPPRQTREGRGSGGGWVGKRWLGTCR